MASGYADDGVAPMAWWAHMLPTFTMDPPRPLRDHPAGHGLGEEEDRPVKLGVGIVVGTVVVQERLGDEQPSRVDQQGGVGVLGGQLLADPLRLHPVCQVGGDAVG